MHAPHVALIAPKDCVVPPFGRPVYDYTHRRLLLGCAQLFRGRKYRADGAIPDNAETQAVGHIAPDDDQAFHLTLWKDHEVVGALWWIPRPYEMPLERLHCYHPSTAEALQRARDRAADAGVAFAEYGGWAAETPRANYHILMLGLAWPLALGRRVIAACIITERHKAIGQVAKLGGTHLGPRYHDERWRCAMQAFVFDVSPLSTSLELTIRSQQLRDAPIYLAHDRKP